MKKYIGFFLAVVLLLTTAGFSRAGSMPEGITSAEKAEAFVRILLGDDPETLDGTVPLTAQMQAAIDMNGGWKSMADALSAALGSAEQIGPARAGTVQGYRAYFVPCVCTGMSVDIILVLEQDALAGISTGPYTGQTGSDADGQAGPDIPESALGGSLPGTLTVPEGDGPFPVVILVHGSGPNDRDETIGNQKPFRDLAEGLPENGIAVYRYDKRTYVYPQEAAADRNMTLMEETVLDAAAAVQLMGMQDRIDPERIWVLGHSLGGTAVPAIAETLSNSPVHAAGYILMAPSARPLQDLMREQYTYLYSLNPGITPEQQAGKDAIFAELDRFGSLDTMSDGELLMGAYVPYWRWLAGYDMIASAKKISEPCLVLQGEEDYQVTMNDFLQLKNALGGQPNWRFVSCPGLTHAFTPGLKSEGSAVYARTDKMDVQVILEIASQIAGR